jgi:hypothetical protein
LQATLDCIFNVSSRFSHWPPPPPRLAARLELRVQHVRRRTHLLFGTRAVIEDGWLLAPFGAGRVVLTPPS